MKKRVFLNLILGLFFIAVPANGQTLTKYDFLPHNNRSFDFMHVDNQPQLKNKNVALAISVGATIASYFINSAVTNSGSPNTLTALTATFIFITAPSAGYIYSDNWDDFWRNSGHRLIAAGVVTVGMFIWLGSALDGLFDEEDDGSNGAGLAAGSIIMVTGGVLFYFSTFRDFIQVRKKVDEYNSKLLNRVELIPVLDPVNSAAGLGFRVNF